MVCKVPNLTWLQNFYKEAGIYASKTSIIEYCKYLNKKDDRELEKKCKRWKERNEMRHKMSLDQVEREMEEQDSRYQEEMEVCRDKSR